MDEKESDKKFAKLLQTVEEPPTSAVQFVGHSMRDWLQNVVADSGTVVDRGAGFSQYDLWVTVDGKELYIQIKGKS